MAGDKDIFSVGILTGMKAICDYTKKSDRTILALVKEHKFPASKIAGQWTSTVSMINEWTTNFIKKTQKEQAKHSKTA